ncbi:MAG: S8 family serine peptidase [Bacteroidia bacterium]|nr:S8 family serine peptidase [Bacteroidia bacterium]
MKLFLHILFFVISSVSYAQQKYWVFLTDKKGTAFDPYEYFDTKAIERRIINDVPLLDSTDFPLCDNYKSVINEKVLEITAETRWFNALAVIATQEQIEQVRELNFVKEVEPMTLKIAEAAYGFDTGISPQFMDLLNRQIESMEGSLFEKNNIDGKGVRIAIFDGGFPTVDKNPAFEHIRENGRVIKTYDFAKKREFVYGYSTHGAMVMSCIGGIVQGKKIGLATGAEFLLARTEVNTEPFSEEENWLAAVEWADKNGAQIINSSLGYTNDRYFNEDMDGKKTLVSRAANMAARKGILVINAMGNDGDGKWKYISAPADADSIISVGGIDPDSEYHISFSSYGPTADKRLKPNVCAYGDVIAAGKHALANVQGTSFASPLVAGFAACALQVNPKIKTMELFLQIEKSGNLFPYFDYAHGYGIPRAGYFVTKTNIETQSTFDFKKDDTYLYIIIRDNILTTPFKIHNYLYYHIENTKGTLDKYAVIKVYQKESLKIPLREIKNNETLRVHYLGYTGTFKL